MKVKWISIGTKSRLKKLIEKVEDSMIPMIKDEYCVRVNLVDTSIYAYAPRRLTFKKREQIREITDNLLERGIIKPSISSYCARIVPARKKDDSLRLYGS